MKKAIAFGLTLYLVFSFLFPVVEVWVVPEIVVIVQDGTAGEPIEDARILVSRNDASMTFDVEPNESGVFLIAPMAEPQRNWPGDAVYKTVLQVNKNGFKGVSTTVTLMSGDMHGSMPALRFSMTFSLVPLDSKLDPWVEERKEVRVGGKIFTLGPVIRKNDS